MAPILGIWASSSAASRADTGAMFPLQVITVGPAGASNISITNIPNTYTHLQIRWIAKMDSGAFNNYNMRFNSDSGANYAVHDLYGNGSTATAQASSSRSNIWTIFMGSTANTFATGIIDILDYANTNKNKTVRMLQGADFNGSGEVRLTSGLWASTSAISQIDIGLGSPTYSQYSQFALYGIKGA